MSIIWQLLNTNIEFDIKNLNLPYIFCSHLDKARSFLSFRTKQNSAFLSSLHGLNSVRKLPLNANQPANLHRFQQLFAVSRGSWFHETITHQPSATNSFYFPLSLFKGHSGRLCWPGKIYYYCFITPQFIYYL